MLEPILLIGYIGLYTVLSYSNALICIVLQWTYYWPNMERYIIKPYTGPLLYVYHTSTHIPYYGMNPQEYYYSVLLHYCSPTSTVSHYTTALQYSVHHSIILYWDTYCRQYALHFSSIRYSLIYQSDLTLYTLCIL